MQIVGLDQHWRFWSCHPVPLYMSTSQPCGVLSFPGLVQTTRSWRSATRWCTTSPSRRAATPGPPTIVRKQQTRREAQSLGAGPCQHGGARIHSRFQRRGGVRLGQDSTQSEQVAQEQVGEVVCAHGVRVVEARSSPTRRVLFSSCILAVR